MFKNKNLIKVLAATVLIGMSFTSCTHLIEKIKDLAGGDDDGYENTNSGNSGSSNGQSTGTKNKKNAIVLTADSWKSASITGSEAWFSFTPNSSIQNIFIKDNNSTLTVTVYDSSDNPIVNFTAYSSSSMNNKVYTSYSTYSTYYIKVSGYGSFSIGVTATPAQPETTITQLTTKNEWENCYTNGTEKWYKFTAPTGYNNLYVYIKPGTLDSYTMQVYNTYCSKIGYPEELDKTDTTYSDYISISANSGYTYYVRVVPKNNYSGSYQLGFTTSSYSPDSNYYD